MPPTPAMWKVAREPSTGAVSMPPAIARQARAPTRAKPVSSTAPAGTATLSHCGSGAPSSVGAIAAPVSAIVVSCSKRSVGPRNWISSPAASPALPTSRLARRKDHMSKGPEGGKPCSQKP